MIFEQRVVVPEHSDRIWDFLMDVVALSRCVPDVQSFEMIDADTFAGTLRVKVGPVGMNLSGMVKVVERERDSLRCRMNVKADEKRLNSSVSAEVTMTLVRISEKETEILIHTDSSVFGKLGEFGQAVMRRKADQLAAEFARNLAVAIGVPSRG